MFLVYSFCLTVGRRELLPLAAILMRPSERRWTVEEASMGKTVIVGGGTAGLAAAYTLDRAGADYSVLEKRDFSGGRIYGK